MIRKWALAVTLLGVVTFPALATPFDIDPNHSAVDFSIRHLISQVRGSFDRFAGKFDLDPETQALSNIRFTIWTDSINTRNAKRDAHLRGVDFFEVETYPLMTFTGISAVLTEPNLYTVNGTLTMHGVSQPVVLKAKYNGMTKVGEKQLVSFTVNTVLNRKAFGINWNKALDNGGFILGDDVQIEVSLEAVNA